MWSELVEGYDVESKHGEAVLVTENPSGSVVMVDEEPVYTIEYLAE